MAHVPFVVGLNPKHKFHPNQRRPAQRLFPLSNAQGKRRPGRSAQGELIFTSRSHLPAGIIGIAGASDTDGIDFLCIDRRPIFQPRTGLRFQFPHGFLRDAFAARGEIESREEFARVRRPAWERFGVKIGSGTNRAGGSFNQVEEASEGKLTTFPGPKGKGAVFADGRLSLALPALSHRATI